MIHGKKGDFVKSTSYAYKALRIFEKLNDRAGVISSYIKLSAIAIQTEDFKGTLLYANKADSLNQILKSESFEIDIANNKAIAFAEQGKLDDALAMFTKIYNITSDKGIKYFSQKVLALMNIGLVYKEKGDYDKAISFYRKSFKESIENNFPEGILKNTQNISQAYHLQGNYAASNKEALLALEKARSMKIIDLEAEILELLKENFLRQNDYKNALKYSEEYYSVLGKLDIEKTEREIGQIKNSYQLEKAKEQLKLVNEINKTRTKQRNLSIIMLLIALLSLVIIAFAYYKIRLLNKQNIKNRKKLQESNDAKDKIFSIIGHDLRSAYAGALTVLTLIKNKELDETDQDALIDKGIIQSKSALETLDNLLVWGYAQIKGSKIKMINFNCFPLIKNNLDFLAESTNNKKITIQNQIPEELFVLADRDHFNFVWRNLLSNAIKFTLEGGIIILGYEDSLNGFYKFFIKDSGIGIANDRLSVIFTNENFSTKGTKNEQGTGLGLILCKEFVELNGGTISAESEMNNGTIFYFTIKKGTL